MKTPPESTRREFLQRTALLTAAAAGAPRAFAYPVDVSHPIYTYDATPLQQLQLADPASAIQIWETMHLLAALQGIVNRYAPRFYLFYCSAFNVATDQFWFDWLRGEGEWLRDAPIRACESVEEVVMRFRREFAGLVVYDPAVDATSNLASTVAGCDNLLPVRYNTSADSIYTLLTGKLGLPVRLSFVKQDGSSLFTGSGTIPGTNQPSSGSAKTDAYYWAIHFYLESGRCNPLFAAYYVDQYWLRRCAIYDGGSPDMHTLSDHDYFIANRGFFFDLSPWGDEEPNDDPDQPLGADLAAMQKILSTLYNLTQGNRMVKIGGFPPWPFKYTTFTGGAHPPVITEWQFAMLATEYNCYMEADAAAYGAIANASFYRHYPLAHHYRQPNPPPVILNWRAAGYITEQNQVAPKIYLGHYVGDYDSPSWLYKAVPAFFSDPARGQVPLNWAFDPNLADRAPQALVYAYRNAKSTDFFIAGDSGAGYVNPRAFTVRPDSQLPSGLEVWTRHCVRYFQRWDMSITGFIIDGLSGASTDTEYAAYHFFSPNGVGPQYDTAPTIHAGIPSCPVTDLPGDVTQAAAFIYSLVKSGGGAQFLWLRSVLETPTWYAQLSQALQTSYPQIPFEVVDAYTFFGLIDVSLQT